MKQALVPLQYTATQLLLLVATGSDLLGQTVAALAAIAIAFETTDATYANTLEAHARDLYV